MQLRYLSSVELKKSTPIKQSNGTYINNYEFISEYKVNKQVLESEIDAQIYGSDINKMYRLTSPLRNLENYLLTKLNNSNDNISMYYIFENGSCYKIVSVSQYKVDIERI